MNLHIEALARPRAYWHICQSEIQCTTHLCSGTYEDDGGDGEDDGDVDANGGDESNLLLLRESLGAAGSTVAKTNCVRMLRHLSTTVNRSDFAGFRLLLRIFSEI